MGLGSRLGERLQITGSGPTGRGYEVLINDAPLTFVESLDPLLLRRRCDPSVYLVPEAVLRTQQETARDG